jgi:hypothetical protein
MGMERNLARQQPTCFHVAGIRGEIRVCEGRAGSRRQPHSRSDQVTSFGNNGRVITNFGGDDDASQAMASLPGGWFIVAGYSNQGNNYDFVATRYWPVEPKMV